MGKDNNFSYYNEFFKVYLSDMSSSKMLIPPAFDVLLKINQVAIPTDVTLKDYTEKIWKVKMERKGNELFIRKGWKRFASYHSLKDGDFMVFKYDGCSHFDVELYGVNGLKKGKCREYGKEVHDVHVKDEPITEEGPMQILPVVASGCKNKNTKMKPTKPRSGASCGGGGSKPRKTHVRKPVKCQGTRVASIVAKNKASFVFKMTEFKRSVYVPLTVLKTYDIRVQKQMRLLDEKGKFWPVQVKFHGNNKIYLSSGWMEFCRAKKLRAGDKCIFEFIAPKDKKSNVIQVQVLSPKRGARTQEHVQIFSITTSSGGNTSKQTENDGREIVVGCESSSSMMKTNPTSKDSGGGGENTGLQRLKNEVNVVQVAEKDGLSALQRAMAFKSKNPYFWLTMQQLHIPPVAMLDLPQWFAKKYLQNIGSSIIMRLPDGRYWRSEFFLEVYKGNTRASLINGWSALVQATHLKINDVCVFELIITDETMLKVHIFRDKDKGVQPGLGLVACHDTPLLQGKI